MCINCWNESLNGAFGRCEMGIVTPFLMPIIRLAPPQEKEQALKNLHFTRNCVDAARSGYVLPDHAADAVCELAEQVWVINQSALISMATSFPARAWGRA